MYNLQITIDRIEQLSKLQGLSINQLLKNASLNKSIVDNMKRGRYPSVDKIYILADYLDCSVDFLLGRTSNPINPNLTTK